MAALARTTGDERRARQPRAPRRRHGLVRRVRHPRWIGLRPVPRSRPAPPAKRRSSLSAWPRSRLTAATTVFGPGATVAWRGSHQDHAQAHQQNCM